MGNFGAKHRSAPIDYKDLGFLMATRPVFIPLEEGPLVEALDCDFPWAPGLAESQKKKNIRALHEAARKDGIEGVLEISTKSDAEIGRRLSAFSLNLNIDGRNMPLESVYQGAKVFRDSGPFPEIMEMPPRESKRFIRENTTGDLIEFCLCGRKFPLNPKNAFYDWLYIRSLADHSDWIKRNVKFSGFTDIEFNPKKQINCQARAFAEFLSLQKRSLLEKSAKDFEFFASLLSPI